MRERVELLGGSLQVESRPGQGTRIVACLPIRQVGEHEEEHLAG
jgi:signal transduction histidine kinase